jgi:diguanylate cyclase (GGDEF)-like protein
MIAHYGSDEFVIMLPETTLRGAEEISRRIRTKVAFEPAPDLPCTVSLGAAEASAQKDIDARGQAGDALYRARLAGRNRSVAVVPIDAIAS